jgi:hypothetical protein
VLLFGATLTACGGAAASPSPSPSPAPTPSGPLLTIESRGGHCMDGPCGRTLIVEGDGRVHEAAKPPNDLGFVEPDLLVALQEAIDAADWATIRSHPFTDTCPVAFDGTEIVLDFGTATGTEHIEGCQVAIDWSSPPFSTIKIALAPWFANP